LFRESRVAIVSSHRFNMHMRSVGCALALSLLVVAPAFADAVTKPVPPENEIRQLVRDNLLRFDEAIKSQSFDAFYESIAVHWQDQLTKGQLQRAFQPCRAASVA